MSRIKGIFSTLKQQGKCALIPYITAGDPDLESSLALMHHLVRAGADIIELGVPFSDPGADGPVIQAAHERALKNKVSLKAVLDLVKRFRQDNKETAIVLMGYLNPFEHMGYKTFATAAAEAGVDAVLTVDLPPEEADDFYLQMQQHKIDCIFLAAPTTSRQRVELIRKKASGFLYYVSVKGVTGSSRLDLDQVKQKCTMLQTLTDLPIGVGFGIKDAQSAKAIARFSDAVIVGSALIKQIEKHQDDKTELLKSAGELMETIRQAIDE